MAKIKVHNIKGLWIALTRIYEVNNVLPSIFDYHMGRFLPHLQKEFERVQNMDEDKFQAVKDEEIEMAVTKIHPNDLPDKIPNDIEFGMKEGPMFKVRTMELLSPILIEEEQQEYESQIDKLLKDVEENGEDS